MLWQPDDRLTRSWFNESALDGAYYACHLHRESLARCFAPQSSNRDGTRCLWGALVHQSCTTFRVVCTIVKSALSQVVLVVLFVSCFPTLLHTCISHRRNDPYDSSSSITSLCRRRDLSRTRRMFLQSLHM